MEKELADVLIYLVAPLLTLAVGTFFLYKFRMKMWESNVKESIKKMIDDKDITEEEGESFRWALLESKWFKKHLFF